MCMGWMVSVKQTGNFQKTDRFLHGLIGKHYRHKLEKYGEKGVEALRSATPKDSGETANAWSYEIVEEAGRTSIFWKNDHIVGEWCNIAIILEFGHATRNGGFVEGRHYIQPAIQPIFDQMAEEVWKEVVG